MTIQPGLTSGYFCRMVQITLHVSHAPSLIGSNNSRLFHIQFLAGLSLANPQYSARVPSPHIPHGCSRAIRRLPGLLRGGKRLRGGRGGQEDALAPCGRGRLPHRPGEARGRRQPPQEGQLAVVWSVLVLCSVFCPGVSLSCVVPSVLVLVRSFLCQNGPNSS